MFTKGVLAIDFGTANTYYCKCPVDQLSPRGIDFDGDGRDGLATAILYRIQHQDQKRPLIGQAALDEFGEATTQERKGYVLRMQFKPNIAGGEEPQRIAADFLRTVLDEARRQRLDIDPSRRQVIFGVPCDASANYRRALGEVAKAAGYGDITMIDEPRGALLYHIYHRDLPATDALRGVLVVDFGGGTCDFAFLHRGNVQSAWGDMRLGGRLFDDLFFSWFLDQNPGVLKTLKKEGNECFVQSFLCRETKERFSRTMTRDSSATVSKALDRFGRITGMTWDAFLGRARSYTASETLRQLLADVGGDGRRAIGLDDPVDLLAAFRVCLTDGLHSAKIQKGDIKSVVLTGGSSLWPFVPDILREELGIERDRIIRSDRPYAAVAEGLALKPALQRKGEATQKKLRKELPGFLKGNLKSLVDERSRHVTQKIVTSMARELFDKQLKPLLIDLLDHKVKKAVREQRLEDAIDSFQPRAEALCEKELSSFAVGLVFLVGEHLAMWFAVHDVVLPEEGVIAKDPVTGRPVVPGIAVPGQFFDNIQDTALLGGSAYALFLAGKLCLIRGVSVLGAPGLLAGAAALLAGGSAAMRLTIGSPWPWMRRDTDAKIRKARKKWIAKIEANVRTELEKIWDHFAKQVFELVEREIDALGDINHLG